MNIRDKDCLETTKCRNYVLRTTRTVWTNPPTTLGVVLNDIQRLFNSSFGFGLNPLPHLRNDFRDFDWSFREICFQEKDRLKGNSQLVVFIRDSDYVWNVGGNISQFGLGFGEGFGQFVLVKRKNVTPDKLRHMCWSDNAKFWPKDLVQAENGHVMVFGDSSDKNQVRDVT